VFLWFIIIMFMVYSSLYHAATFQNLQNITITIVNIIKNFRIEILLQYLASELLPLFLKQHVETVLI
jgi:hypothetical protein